MLIAPESIMLGLIVILLSVFTLGVISMIPMMGCLLGKYPKVLTFWYTSLGYLGMMLALAGPIGQEFGEHGGIALQIGFLVLFLIGLLTGVLIAYLERNYVRVQQKPEVS